MLAPIYITKRWRYSHSYMNVLTQLDLTRGQALWPACPLMRLLVAAGSLIQWLQELCCLPAWLATEEPCRETHPPSHCLEWPAEQGESGAPGAIGRMSKAAATSRHVSGQAGHRGWPLVNSCCMGVFVRIPPSLITNYPCIFSLRDY